jgi:hypothetical protein
MNEVKENISEQLLRNIQLDQYDQLSCSDPDSKIIASYGPLVLNELQESYFDLSECRDFDQFHPLASQHGLKEKFLDSYAKSNRAHQIDLLTNSLTKNCNNIVFTKRVITITNANTDFLSLLKGGIKGNFIDSKTIKLYLPLVIKDKYIRDIVSILKDLCT